MILQDGLLLGEPILRRIKSKSVKKLIGIEETRSNSKSHCWYGWQSWP